MTIQGTCYFRSLQDAYRYYKMEFTDKEMVNEKIKNKEICIGLPPNHLQYKIYIIEGRYHIEEK